MGGACSRKRDQYTVEAAATDDGQSSRSGRLSRSVSLRWPVKPLETLAASGAHGARAPPTLLEICVREIVKVRHLHSCLPSFAQHSVFLASWLCRKSGFNPMGSFWLNGIVIQYVM